MRNCFTIFLSLFVPVFLYAQFPYNESCKNTTAPGFVISGSARLTAAAGIDAAGAGYLRLTDNTLTNVGYAYAQDSFPANYGLTASFEFFSWKPGANSTNQADGMTFFLFDASVNAFRPGGVGGALGYAQYYGTPGLAKGYIGISIDAFGNFSNPSDGAKNGGPGQQRGSIAIRGPGNGKSATDYVYQTGVVASDAAYNAGFQGFTQRYYDPTNTNYRKLKIVLTPGSSAGASIGYKVTVIMYKGGTTLTPVTLINNFDYPFPAPAKLQFGFAASTGSISNYHEIRNITVDVTNTSALAAPTAAADAVTIACQGQPTLIDVTANDASNNSGGAINKATVDLDPATAGIQASYTDAGKGTYTADANGIVSFVPVAGFSGTSNASYTVNDTYGLTAAASTIVVNVNNSAAPALVLTDPSPVCAPGSVDLANPAWKTTTAAGASFSYFSTLSDANNGTNSMTATAVSQAGTYYIRETLGGCATIKPISVQINAAPTASYAGPDLTFCSSTGSQGGTLLATNPDAGTGVWTQVSGPSTATINYPESATTPVSNMAKGVYVFRWTMSSTGCASSIDDAQVSVGIAASAGSTQTLCNAASATLAANAATPGTGAWTQLSGAAVSFANTADPATTITGLTPGSSYSLQWKITNGGCSSTSSVVINSTLNTVADAGLDRIVPGLSSFSLSGNAPDAGNTGTWTIVSQPALSAVVIANANSATTNITSATLGDYTFRWTIANGGCLNADDVTIHVNTALPIRLLSFTASSADQMAWLHWTTTGEQMNDRFEIERSEDGGHFKKISALNGAGSSVKNDYSYHDDMRQLTGQRIYYRLKLVDHDGSFTYSPVVSLYHSRADQLTVLSNPFTDQLRLRMQWDGEGNCAFKLYDQQGSLLKTQEQQLVGGANLVVMDQLQQLSPGIYLLKIAADGYLQTVKVCKK